MASLLITGDTVTVQLSPVEKAEALHGNVTVPRSAVTSVRAVEDGMDEIHGLRMPGTGIPGLLMVGTVRDHDFVTFAVCHARRPAIVIDLAGQPFSRLVITLDDAEAMAAGLTRLPLGPRARLRRESSRIMRAVAGLRGTG